VLLLVSVSSQLVVMLSHCFAMNVRRHIMSIVRYTYRYRLTVTKMTKAHTLKLRHVDIVMIDHQGGSPGAANPGSFVGLDLHL